MPPTVIAVDGIGAVEREVFGPVLHVAGFRAADLDRVVDAINARGFGLTFGLHSRIDDRVERVTARLHVGNAYVNRNQIGAIVGSQPFGGEGLSGTGPKAGGPFYLPPAAARAGGAGARRRRRGPRSRRRRWPRRWRRSMPATGRRGATGWRRCARRSGTPAGWCGAALAAAEALPQAPLDLPGPTGESNRLSLHPRGRVLCLGAGAEAVLAQAVQALAAGNAVLAVAAGRALGAGGAGGAAGRRASPGRSRPRASRTCPSWRWSPPPGRRTGCGRCAGRSAGAAGRSCRW